MEILRWPGHFVRHTGDMGSGGMKRKKRRRLPKVSNSTTEWGTLPLGQDPPFGPWGPMERIEAFAKIARALKAGGPPRNPEARTLVVIALGVCGLVGVAAWVAATFAR
jgi:hypothetical protein